MNKPWHIAFVGSVGYSIAGMATTGWLQWITMHLCWLCFAAAIILYFARRTQKLVVQRITQGGSHAHR